MRVCLLGAESTGKTTLARALAERYGTVWNPEYGRPYTEIGRPEGAVDELASSRTSPACSAGTRTSSPDRDAACCSATPTRSRRPSSTRSTSARPRPASRARRPAVRPLPRVRARRPLAARRDPRVREAAALDARAVRRARARHGCAVARRRGRRSRSGSRRCRRIRGRAVGLQGAERPAHDVVTKATQSWHCFVANTDNDADRIGSGWWVGVPRRKASRERAASELSARSGARSSSAP